MINTEILQQAFTAAQNDMMVMVEEAKAEFYRPDIEREGVTMWAKLPPMMKAMITARNPQAGKAMDRKLEEYKKGREV